jgi:hypothetical protein
MQNIGGSKGLFEGSSPPAGYTTTMQRSIPVARSVRPRLPTQSPEAPFAEEGSRRILIVKSQDWSTKAQQCLRTRAAGAVWLELRRRSCVYKFNLRWGWAGIFSAEGQNYKPAS